MACGRAGCACTCRSCRILFWGLKAAPSHSKALCPALSASGPFPMAGLSAPLQARRQFQSQLADLQQLPDILKITEAKLAECQDQLQGYERKNIDLTAIISDLRSRVRDWQKGSHELARGVRLPR